MEFINQLIDYPINSASLNPVHVQSISSHTFLESNYSVLLADSEGHDQTVGICRLIKLGLDCLHMPQDMFSHAWPI